MSEPIEVGDFGEEVKAPEKKPKPKSSKSKLYVEIAEGLTESSAPSQTELESFSAPATGEESSAVEELEKKQEAALDVLFPPAAMAPVPLSDESVTLTPGAVNCINDQGEPVEPNYDLPYDIGTVLNGDNFPADVSTIRKFLWEECGRLNTGKAGSFGTLMAQKFRSADVALIELVKFLLSQGFYKDATKQG